MTLLSCRRAHIFKVICLVGWDRCATRADRQGFLRHDEFKKPNCRSNNHREDEVGVRSVCMFRRNLESVVPGDKIVTVFCPATMPAARAGR